MATPNAPDLDACSLLPDADIVKATGIEIAGPGQHDFSPLIGESRSVCYYQAAGEGGGEVTITLEPAAAYDSTDLSTRVLGNGHTVKTDTYQVDTRGTGQAPITATGVWYRAPGTDHVVRCEAHRNGAATYDFEAAAALAQLAADAL